MFRPKKLIFIFWFLFLGTGYAGAQDGALQFFQNGYNFRQYTEANGLVYNQCKSLFQDSRGFLWISTFHGLSRFDGRNFTNFGLREGLPGLDIAQVCEDKSGFIYVATSRGIARYTGPDSKGQLFFKTYSQIGEKPVSGLQAIDSNTIIFECTGEPAYLLKQGKVTTFGKRPLIYPGSILRDSAFNVYLYAPDTLTVYDSRLRHLNDIFFPVNGFVSMTGGHRQPVEVYDGKSIFRLSPAGLTHLRTAPDSISGFCRPANDALIYTVNRNDIRQLRNNQPAALFDLRPLMLYINDIHLANDQSIWVATHNQGIFRITRLPFQEWQPLEGGSTTLQSGIAVLSTTATEQRNPDLQRGFRLFSNYTIRAVHESTDGITWFATSGGVGMMKKIGQPGFYPFEGLRQQYGPAAREIRGVVESANGDVWLHGFPGIIRYRSGVFRQFTTEDGLPPGLFIRYLVIDKHNTVFAADFMHIYQVQDDKLIKNKAVEQLNGFTPNIIRTDRQGDLWADYRNILYKITRNSSGTYIITDSIETDRTGRDPEINRFEFDGEGNCWVLFSGGVMKVFFRQPDGHYDADKFARFYKDDGLSEITVRDFYMTADDKGQINFVSRDRSNPRAYRFTIEEARQRMAASGNKPAFTAIYLNYKQPAIGSLEQTGSDGLPVCAVFKYSSNDISFSYTCPVPGMAAAPIFRVMLKGFDDDWIITPVPTTGYTNLPSGTFEFHVCVLNSNGTWSEPAVFKFRILTPWYRTWWAILLWCLLGALLIMVVFRLRVNNLRRNYDLESLRTSNLFKSRLIALIGHDMMTQLKYIAKVALQLRTYGERLSKQTVSDSLGEINTTASHLHFFGESIIHWIKLQGKGFSPVLTPFQLDNLVNELIIIHQPLAAEKGNTLVNDLTSPISCIQDATLVKIILHNLMLNSNKFTDRGTISIGGHIAEDELKIYVQDTGVGMPPEYVQALNAMQPVASSKGTGKEAGFGMGYVIIIDLVKFSGGSLLVESVPGKSTRVTITLPAYTSEE